MVVIFWIFWGTDRFHAGWRLVMLHFQLRIYGTASQCLSMCRLCSMGPWPGFANLLVALVIVEPFASSGSF
jgi:hypothetical protein